MKYKSIKANVHVNPKKHMVGLPTTEKGVQNFLNESQGGCKSRSRFGLVSGLPSPIHIGNI